MPQTTMISKVLVECMYGVSTVYVLYLYSACMVQVRCIGAYVENFVYGANHLLCSNTVPQHQVW